VWQLGEKKKVGGLKNTQRLGRLKFTYGDGGKKSRQKWWKKGVNGEWETLKKSEEEKLKYLSRIERDQGMSKRRQKRNLYVNHLMGWGEKAEAGPKENHTPELKLQTTLKRKR